MKYTTEPDNLSELYAEVSAAVARRIREEDMDLLPAEPTDHSQDASERSEVCLLN